MTAARRRALTHINAVERVTAKAARRRKGAAFEASARASLAAQAELEAGQQGSFAEFVERYMAAIEPGQ